MKKDKLYGPMCQSCGRPLMGTNDFGRTENNVINMDYCIYCFDKGKFTKPDITMEGMADWVAKYLNETQDTPVEEAREAAMEILPKLDRWKKKDE